VKVWKKWVKSLMVLGCSFVFLTACSVPQVSAESRFFVDLSLNFLEKYELSKFILFNDQPGGTFSSLTYKIPGYGNPTDEGIRFYGLTDASAKIQTIKFDLNPSGSMNLQDISLENSTILKNQQNQPLSDSQLYPDSIAFSPRNSVFISTKTLEKSELPPSIAEYDLTTGQLKNTVPLSSFYLPQFKDSDQIRGIEPQFGFKALTISPDGFSPDGRDPFRLFTVTEKPLIQDRDPEDETKLRLLHYVIADRASFLVSETLYLLDKTSQKLVNIVAGQSGIFLSLEQSGDSGKIYQLFTGDATDTSRIASLKGDLSKIQPVRKKLLLDLQDLGITVPNLTGMTLGSRLPDGSQSLVILNHQNDGTEFLLFSLRSDNIRD
jgi:hypothetical protein